MLHREDNNPGFYIDYLLNILMGSVVSLLLFNCVWLYVCVCIGEQEINEQLISETYVHVLTVIWRNYIPIAQCNTLAKLTL